MKLFASMLCALALAACGDDDNGVTDPMTPDGDVGGTAARQFTLRIDNIAPWTVLKASSQRTQTTGDDGPLQVGEAYEVRFTAGAGHVLSFATMLVESNDWFFAPDPDGIPLYIDGQPLSGDITRFVRLFDAGTEANQEPGVGDATGINQRSRNTGAADPDNRIRLVPNQIQLPGGITFTRPAVASMIRVTLTPGDDRQFTLRIENVSNGATLQTSLGPRPITLSPVAFAVHRLPGALFVVGEPVPPTGLEALAEDGNADTLSSSLRFERGVATPISPGVFVVHQVDAPLFAPGVPDVGIGLEALAEDGNPVPLFDALQAGAGNGITVVGAFDTPVGAEGPGLAVPGQAFEVTFDAMPGDRLSFATMYGASNDWFFAPGPEGIPLFLGEIPRWGDVTSEVLLFDAGTENDEELDVGPNTATQQPAPDTGRDDRVVEVREVTVERYETPVIRHLRVTLTPAEILAGN